MDRKNGALKLMLPAGVWISIGGIAALVLTLATGFESANSLLLWTAAAAVGAAPFLTLIHLYLRGDLSPAQRRRWMKALSGSKAPRAFGDYLRTHGRIRLMP